MKSWVVEPHDSFIARDGRPFGLFAGVRAVSLPFPFPSTLTGGVRTRDGLNQAGIFDTNTANIDRVKAIDVRGFLLVQLDSHANVDHWYAPAPEDALVADPNDQDKMKASILRLTPGGLPEGAVTNYPDELLPLYSSTSCKGKPHPYAPRFWRWNNFLEWLIEPRDFVVENLDSLGIVRLVHDQRSHVAIQTETQASEEGFLFQSRGLEFTKQKRTGDLKSAKRLAMVVNSEATNIKKGVASLGGERRLVSWRQFKGTPDLFQSKCPDEIVESIVANKACRVVLLTPAYFEAGWKPARLLETGNLVMRAAAVASPQVISGWDFELNKPKPTRRLVPGGSVFFLTIDGHEEEIRKWIDTTWMTCVSDDDSKFDATPRRDGFGLAALGTWKPEKGL
jgi:CRISPR-associated protein Cmr3